MSNAKLPSKIWFLGDVHSKFRHILYVLEKTPLADRPEAVIFLGDIESPRPFEDEIKPILACDIEVFWIRGNHDTDSEQNWRNLSSPESMARNIDGRVITVAGIRIGGMGGIFRGDIWYPRPSQNAKAVMEPSFHSYDAYCKDLHQKQGLKKRLSKMDLIQGQAVPEPQWVSALTDTTKNGRLRKHCSTIFPNVFDSLADQRCDILVTHEAPLPHPHGFEELNLLASSMGATRVFHGHHHDRLEFPEIDRLKVCGVGLRGISDDHGRVILEGELDRQRSYRNDHVNKP